MIELVHDPFSLWAEGHDLVVESPTTRRQAYAAIDSRLRGNQRADDTLTVIVAPAYWRQFRSAYRDVSHVSLREVTPSSLLSERVHRAPPEWLDDQLIHDLKLDVDLRTMPMNESWPKWIVEGFFPVLDTEEYADWLRAAYDCEDFRRPLPNEIASFLLSRVRLLLHDTPLDDATSTRSHRGTISLSCRPPPPRPAPRLRSCIRPPTGGEAPACLSSSCGSAPEDIRVVLRRVEKPTH